MNYLFPSPSTLLLLVMISTLPAAGMASQLVHFADTPYPPYVLGELEDEIPKGGTAVDLVNQLFAELPNHEVKFELLPWKRVLMELEKGAVDAVTMVAQTPERSQFLDYSAALVRYQLALFYSTAAFPDGFKWHNLPDLSNYRIGVVEGYLSDSKLSEFIAEGTPLNTIRLSGTETQLFGMLLKGRVDLICFKLESGSTLLRQQGWWQDIKAHPKAIYKGSYHLGFSKARQHQPLIEQLNPIIDEWRENGKLDAILHPHSPR